MGQGSLRGVGGWDQAASGFGMVRLVVV
jgi:hypothetical protein